MSQSTLEELTEAALNIDADTVQLVEDFPHRTALEIPMNPHIEGDTEMLPVAELSLEDSGYAPLLWGIAIEYLKEQREAMAEVDALNARIKA